MVKSNFRLNKNKNSNNFVAFYDLPTSPHVKKPRLCFFFFSSEILGESLVGHITTSMHNFFPSPPPPPISVGANPNSSRDLSRRGEGEGRVPNSDFFWRGEGVQVCSSRLIKNLYQDKGELFLPSCFLLPFRCPSRPILPFCFAPNSQKTG